MSTLEIFNDSALYKCSLNNNNNNNNNVTTAPVDGVSSLFHETTDLPSTMYKEESTDKLASVDCRVQVHAELHCSLPNTPAKSESNNTLQHERAFFWKKIYYSAVYHVP